MQGYFIPFGARSIVSIDKKIDMQIKELSRIATIEEVDVRITSKGIIRNALSVLPFVDLPWDYQDAYAKIINPDFIFMRRTGADRQFIKFLRHIKAKYPKCKILMEVVTYPYLKASLQSVAGCFFLPKEIYNTSLLKRYVDRVVTYTNDSEIWNIPTIQTMNGIIVDSIKPIHDRKNCNDNSVRLLVVAVLQKGHGYERCIKGLYEYYRSGLDRKIEIHIVGNGKELAHYKKLTMRYGLEGKVFFYGRQIGEELDEIYNNMDIGLGALGLYKQGIYQSSSLKIREYLAKGLPIISGCREDVFDNISDCPYFLQVPNDDSVIDMRDVLTFYDRIYSGNTKRQEVHKKIRELALKRIDMNITMQPILSYIMDRA